MDPRMVHQINLLIQKLPLGIPLNLIHALYGWLNTLKQLH